MIDYIIRYRFLIDASYCEKMWDFGKAHDVKFHCIRKIFGTEVIAYEALMTSETHLLFKICIPSRDYK